MLRLIFFILLLQSFVTIQAKTDDPPANVHFLPFTVINGDTIPLIYLPEVRIYETRTFKSAKQEKQYGKLKRDVVKVYPYAKKAKELLQKYQSQMQGMSERERKKLMKKAEDDLRAQFEDELKKLTMTQGRILIRLIDRETGSTSYDLVKDLRGTFQAFFWQGLARLFGANLKAEFDPVNNTEDKFIEEIIQLIEAGDL